MIIRDQTGEKIIFTETGCSCSIEETPDDALYNDGECIGDEDTFPFMIVFRDAQREGRAIVLGVYYELERAKEKLTELMRVYQTKGCHVYSFD